jgi:hypothetical protein
MPRRNRRIREHINDDDSCWRRAAYIRYEVTSRSEQRLGELLEEYYQQHQRYPHPRIGPPTVRLPCQKANPPPGQGLSWRGFPTVQRRIANCVRLPSPTARCHWR